MKKITFLICAYFVLIIHVNAGSSNLDVVCPKEMISPGESMTCDLMLEVTDESIESINFKVNSKLLNVLLETESFSEFSSCSQLGNGVTEYQINDCSFENPITQSTKIANIILTAPNKIISTTESINFSNIELISKNINVFQGDSFSKSINVVGNFELDDSSNASISIVCPKTTITTKETLVCDVNLNVTNTLIDFTNFVLDGSAKSSVKYELFGSLFQTNDVLDNDSITMVNYSNMEAISNGGKIGEISISSSDATVKDVIIKDIEIGNSKFSNILYKPSQVMQKITIVSEIVEVESDVNTLESINIDGNLIEGFSIDRLSYSQNVSSESISISVEKTDSKSVVTGDIGVKKLEYGINNFKVNVTSESGKVKTYFLEITRIDNRSKVNTLKSLSIDKAPIRFNSATLTYNVTVENDVTEVEVSSELFDAKSKYIKDFGNRKVSLNDGLNVIKIGIEAENGEERFYTINVTRKIKDNSIMKDTSIKQLVIQGKALTSVPTSYDIEIKEINSLDIKVTLLNEKATYEIIGNDNLKDGSVVIIKVTSEDRSFNKEYKINVKVINEENSSDENLDNDELVDEDDDKDISELDDLNFSTAVVVLILGIVVFLAGIIKYNIISKKV